MSRYDTEETPLFQCQKRQSDIYGKDLLSDKGQLSGRESPYLKWPKGIQRMMPSALLIF